MTSSDLEQALRRWMLEDELGYSEAARKGGTVVPFTVARWAHGLNLEQIAAFLTHCEQAHGVRWVAKRDAINRAPGVDTPSE